ncbi:MAG: hypothetical protein ABIY51_08730 [Ferruginibacter sp.]
MDIILDILKKSVSERPESPFLTSLYQQYCERGGLSKKQLEGLHSKISKIEGFPTSYLATLEAIILKKPTRFKSEVSTTVALPETQDAEFTAINSMLAKYPAHKRLLYFKAKVQNREKLSSVDITEIEKFKKLLL